MKINCKICNTELFIDDTDYYYGLSGDLEPLDENVKIINLEFESGGGAMYDPTRLKMYFECRKCGHKDTLNINC